MTVKEHADIVAVVIVVTAATAATAGAASVAASVVVVYEHATVASINSGKQQVRLCDEDQALLRC